jgi:hypothetical protein
MKLLSSLTAVAALAAGMSFASAQMPSSPSQGAPVATGTGKFCVQISKSNNGLNCKFASIKACTKEAQAQGLQCSPNPNQGTTGAK